MILNIYTDASCKNNGIRGSFIIVKNNTIIETVIISFGNSNCNFNSDKYEYRTIKSSIRHVIKNYHFNKIVLYCDNINAIKKFKNNFSGYLSFVEIQYIKSHNPRGSIHNKLNCLADYACRNSTTKINKHFKYLMTV